MNIKGRGRTKKWLNMIKEDMRVAGLCVDEVEDWAKWRFRMMVANSK